MLFEESNANVLESLPVLDKVCLESMGTVGRESDGSDEIWHPGDGGRDEVHDRSHVGEE